MKRTHSEKATGSRTKKSKRKSSKSSVALAHTTGEKSGSPNEKSGRKIAAHVGFQKGDPRINRTIPGPGRPRGKFARKCRRVLNNPKTWRAVRSALKNENNPAFKGMWTEVTNRGYGKVQSEVALTLPPGTDDDGNEVPNATFLLIGKLDAMEKRKHKAEEKK